MAKKLSFRKKSGRKSRRKSLKKSGRKSLKKSVKKSRRRKNLGGGDIVDIVDTAVSDGQFKTLVAAVKAAGLVETLKGDGPFTVFAPTDAAFAKLPSGTVEFLLKPENKAELTNILTYHVVPGKMMAADVVKKKTIKTLQGKRVKVKVEGEKVMINNANVLKTDIETSNGVIHVIDTVLIPKLKKKSVR
jgi:transforming growth factor-beta-induced protein